jgi:ribosomal protein S18 acetylase RimI-like enzyme
MNQNILLYEELSLNAVPALQTQFYDGWVLRFTDGYRYTNRASSVNPLYPSAIDLPAKVAECEKRYFSQGLPAVFKFCGEAGTELEALLEQRGYAVLSPTYLMTAALSGEPCVSADCAFTGCIGGDWLDAYFSLSNYTDPVRISIGTKMLGNIQAGVLCARLVKDGVTAACGLCTLERGYAGLFNVIVGEGQRGKGYGRELCTSLLSEAGRLGAHTAYLQVMQDNPAAISLYEKLGFTVEYKYWYRVK